MPTPEPTATPAPTAMPTAAPRPTPTPAPSGPWSLRGGTPLHQAVFDRDLAKVEELLSQGADLDAGDATIENDEDSVVWHEVRPLHLAAFNSDRATAAMLLDWGADTELGAFTEGDQYSIYIQEVVAYPTHTSGTFTPLFVAVRYNENPEMVALLLERGANSDSDTQSGLTPLNWALRYNHDSEVVSLLLEAGASIDSPYDFQIPSWSEEGSTSFSWMPLHLAAVFNPDPAAVTLLLEWGSYVDHWGGEYQGGPGIETTRDGLIHIPEKATLLGLLQAGFIRATPLQLAAAFNPNPEVADVLLKWGAELHGFEEFRDEEWWHLVRRYELEYERPPLHWALRYNSSLAVAELLLERGASLEYQGYQGTPLHYATAYGNPEIAGALLDKGADAKATDSDGNTPCQLARERGRFTGTPVLGRLCRP